MALRQAQAALPQAGATGAALRAGLAYWAIVFTAAFAMGTVRTLWLAPRIGPTAAVLCELPLMLAVSWLTARILLNRHPLQRARDRAIMGLTAFAVLMLAECVLAVFLFGQTAGQWAAALVTMPGPLGLAGQLGFAAMPLVVGLYPSAETA